MVNHFAALVCVRVARLWRYFTVQVDGQGPPPAAGLLGSKHQLPPTPLLQ